MGHQASISIGYRREDDAERAYVHQPLRLRPDYEHIGITPRKKTARRVLCFRAGRRTDRIHPTDEVARPNRIKEFRVHELLQSLNYISDLAQQHDLGRCLSSF